MRHLLDTNVVSELISRRPKERVVRWRDDLDPNDAYLSAITIGEIRKGAEKLPDSRRKETIHRWLSEDPPLRFEGRILNLCVNAGLTWGVLTGRLEKAENAGRGLAHRSARPASQTYASHPKRRRLPGSGSGDF